MEFIEGSMIYRLENLKRNAQRNTAFISQKLNYIHENPCWNLAVSPQDYGHSSARFYLLDEHATYEVTSYSKLADIDLTK